MGRRSLVLVASVAVGLVATGCGSSGSSGAKPVKQADAKTFAQKVNLVAADLPGYKGTGGGAQDAQSEQEAATLATCTGSTAPSKEWSDISSPDFDKGSGLQEVEVSSEVEVLPTAAQATHDYQVTNSDKGRKCLADGLNTLIAGSSSDPSVKFGTPVITPEKITVPGAPQAFRLSVKLPITAQGVSTTALFDLIGMSVGQSKLTLSAFGLQSAPDSAQQEKLAAVLAKRAAG